MRTTAVGAIVLVLGLLLTACGNNAAAQREVSAAQSAAIQAQAWTIPEAGQKYLDMTDPSNNDANTLAGLDNTAPLADFQASLSLLGNDVGLFAEQLESGNWPESVQPAITALIPAVRAEQVAVQKAITGASVAAIRSALAADAKIISAAKARSAAVRTALGLPAS
jgi:hypothetical protein